MGDAGGVPHLRGRGGSILNVGSITAQRCTATSPTSCVPRSAEGRPAEPSADGQDQVLFTMLLPTVDDESWRNYAAANASDVEPLPRCPAGTFVDPGRMSAARRPVSDLNATYRPGFTPTAVPQAAPFYRPARSRPWGGRGPVCRSALDDAADRRPGLLELAFDHLGRI